MISCLYFVVAIEAFVQQRQSMSVPEGKHNKLFLHASKMYHKIKDVNFQDKSGSLKPACSLGHLLQ